MKSSHKRLGDQEFLATLPNYLGRKLTLAELKRIYPRILTVPLEEEKKARKKKIKAC